MKIPSRLTLTEGNLATFEGGKDSPRRFEMVAYSGAAMDAPLLGKVIIDLKGMNFSGKKKPVLRQHDHDRIAGYSDQINNTGSSLVMSGSLSAKTDAGREVADLADEGFPWQASVGIDFNSIDQVKKGDSVEVNGKEFAGPGVIIRKSILKESSFVPLGADDATSGVVFSADADKFIDLPTQTEEPTMTIAEFKKFASENPDATKEFYDAGFEAGKVAAKPQPAKAYELKEAFPNHSKFAIDQLTLEATLDGAKAAFADVLSAELTAKNAKITELEAALAKATEGQGAVGFTASSPPTQIDQNDPKAVAEAEWKADTSLHSSFSSKENYINVRVAEIEGKFRNYAPASQRETATTR